ncbi:aconitate hydratase B, partial [Escherichia coli]
MLLFCKQINTSSKSCYSARCGTGHLPYKLLSHRSVKRIACRTMTMRARRTVVLEEYRKHVAERAAEGIAPKPLDANQMAALVELLKNPPAGEEEFLLDLLTNRVPPGVDEAAYVKAGFLAAIA